MRGFLSELNRRLHETIDFLPKVGRSLLTATFVAAACGPGSTTVPSPTPPPYSCKTEGVDSVAFSYFTSPLVAYCTSRDGRKVFHVDSKAGKVGEPVEVTVYVAGEVAGRDTLTAMYSNTRFRVDGKEIGKIPTNQEVTLRFTPSKSGLHSIFFEYGDIIFEKLLNKPDASSDCCYSSFINVGGTPEPQAQGTQTPIQPQKTQSPVTTLPPQTALDISPFKMEAKGYDCSTYYFTLHNVTRQSSREGWDAVRGELRLAKVIPPSARLCNNLESLEYRDDFWSLIVGNDADNFVFNSFWNGGEATLRIDKNNVRPASFCSPNYVINASRDVPFMIASFPFSFEIPKIASSYTIEPVQRRRYEPLREAINMTGNLTEVTEAGYATWLERMFPSTSSPMTIPQRDFVGYITKVTQDPSGLRIRIEVENKDRGRDLDVNTLPTQFIPKTFYDSRGRLVKHYGCSDLQGERSVELPLSWDRKTVPPGFRTAAEVVIPSTSGAKYITAGTARPFPQSCNYCAELYIVSNPTEVATVPVVPTATIPTPAVSTLTPVITPKPTPIPTPTPTPEPTRPPARGTISGYIWEDLNSNSARDGERNLAGAAVRVRGIDNCNRWYSGAVTTDSGSIDYSLPVYFNVECILGEFQVDITFPAGYVVSNTESLDAKLKCPNLKAYDNGRSVSCVTSVRQNTTASISVGAKPSR